MNDDERQTLQRDLSDALAVLQQNRPVATLAGLADHLVRLGGSYRFHGALIQGALTRRDDGTIIAQLIQVLGKLERGVH